jgi:branched-chain amino acid transport system permease protein
VNRFLIGAAAFAALAILAPLAFQLDPYLAHMAVLIAVYALLALSMNIIWGLAGQFSMAQLAFFQIGAYATSILVTKLQWGYWPALLVAAGLAVVASLLIGAFSFRLTGMYFAIVTLAFAQLITMLVVNVPNVTGGSYGLPARYRPEGLAAGPLELSFVSAVDYYWVAVATLAVGLLLTYQVARSRTGRAMSAAREDELLAQSVGVDLRYYKTIAFALSSVLAALGGGYLAPYLTFISPSMFGFGALVNVILMLVVGGVGSLAGPLLGAALFVVLPEVLRVAGNVRLGLYGGVLILVVIFLPRGLVGLPALLWGAIAGWRRAA